MKTLLSIFLGIFISIPTLGNTPLNISVHSSTPQTQGNKYYAYDFGNTRVDTTEWAYIYLENSSSQPEHLRGVFISGSAYDAYSDCPHILYPGQRCLTTVRFRPWHEGYHRGLLRFAFPSNNIYVDLYGWGVR